MAFDKFLYGKKDIGQILSSRTDIPHYYGDYVRRFFMLVAVLTLLVLPFFPDFLPWAGPMGALLLAIVLVLCAGMTSPTRRLVIYTDLIMAFTGLLVFEYAAVFYYLTDPLFLSVLRQLEAIIFAYSFYYSGKSLRGAV